MAQTSPLPEPTRVDNQDFVSSEMGVGAGARVGDSRRQHSVSGVGLGGGSMTGVANTSQAQIDVPFVYSDEELAVLAESFFSQREEFDPGINNDWWNTGNL